MLAAFAAALLARDARGPCTGLTFNGSPQATVGVAYSARITLDGGAGPATFTQAGQLPPGLAFQPVPATAQANVTGTPTRAGTFLFSVVGRDNASGANCGRTFTIVVADAAPSVAVIPAALSDGVVGLAYSQRISAAGGGAPYTFAPVGPLPPGLSLAADGTLAGTPTAAGTFAFGVLAADAGGGSATAAYTVLVTASPVARLLVSMTDGGVPWGDIPYGSDPGPAFSYAVTAFNAGTAPATNVAIHLLLDEALSPCEAAAAGGSHQQALDMTLGTLSPGERRVTSIRRDVCVEFVLGITGTAGISTYQLISQASLSAAESSSETAVVVTPYCGAALCTVFCPLRYLSGYPCPDISLLPGALQPLSARAGVPFSQTLTASGGTPPYRFSARDLPAGLSIQSSTGALSGSPAAPGRYEVTVGVEDASGNLCHAEQTYRLDVCPADGTPLFSPQYDDATRAYPLADATRGQLYEADILLLCAAPGSAVEASGLPAGLTLDASRSPVRIRGTPAVAGVQSFTLRASDPATGRSRSAAYSIHVRQCALSVGPATLPDARVGQLYQSSIPVAGGHPPYRGVAVTPTCGTGCCQFVDALFHDNVCSGIVDQSALQFEWGIFLLPGSPAIQGFPKQDGNPAFNVVIADSTPDEPCTGSGTFTLHIQPASRCGTIELPSADLPSGRVGIPYSASLPTSGGSAPFTFASDDLPSGLGLWFDTSGERTGLLHGTPAAAGTYAVTVVARDSNGCFGRRTYTLVVEPNPACNRVYLSPFSVPAGTAGVPYSGTSVPSNRITGAGGVRPYRLSIDSMPAGLDLAIDSSTGDLTGTPSRSGDYQFTVTATDGNPAGACSGSYRYRIAIQPGVLGLAAQQAEATAAPSAGGGLSGFAGGALRILRDAAVLVRTVLRDLSLYYEVRDRLLSATPGGRELTRLYYRNAAEITSLLRSDASMRDLAFAAASAWEPQLRALVRGAGADTRFTQAMADSMTALLGRMQQLGSPALRADLAAQAASFPLASWVGLTMDEARGRLDRRPCVASDSALCLNGGRFRVEVAWGDFAGNTGAGHGVALTGDTGYFWFFTASNVELVVKAVDGRAVNGNFWVFYGALSNVPYTITMTDTATGTVRSYVNPSGNLGSVADTTAFPGS